MSKIPWNKGKLVGQKRPLKLEHVWAIRVRLEITENLRDLVLFNLAIDSKLRGCDLVSMMVGDVCNGTQAKKRGQVIQRKTQQVVQFEITQRTRAAIERWIKFKGLYLNDYLFPSRIKNLPHLSFRRYHCLVKKWVSSIGLDSCDYGTHSLRRTKVSLIYKETKNLRAVQLLLGHTSLESTVRYLGVEVDDALALSENMEI